MIARSEGKVTDSNGGGRGGGQEVRCLVKGKGSKIMTN